MLTHSRDASFAPLQMLFGAVFGTLLNIGVIGALWETGGVASAFLLSFFGAFQWAYLLPIMLLLRRRERPAIANGILLTGAVCLALNAALYLGPRFEP